MQIEKALYSSAAVDMPMIVTMHIGNVGKTSMDLVTKVEDETNSCSLLVSRIHRVVCVDPVLRKAAPIDEDFRTRFFASMKGSAPQIYPAMDVSWRIPNKHFRSSIRVRYDDMDFLFHTNQGLYFTYASECAAQAASSGFYTAIRDDICYYNVKMAYTVHQEESFAGDHLEVVTWEDHDNPLLLYFIITKKNKHIFFAKIEYYDCIDVD